MKTSESIANITKALAAAQGEIKNPPCDKLVTVQHKSGGKHSFKYAQLPTCYDVTRAALSKNGLAHFTAQVEIEGGIKITCRLAHESGEWIESSMPLPHQADPKLMAGNLTYYRRYLFNGLVGIAGDDDLDDQAGMKKEPPENPAEYVMQTGKAFKGKKLSELDMYALADFSKWITNECTDPSEQLLEDRDAIEAFLKTKEKKQ